MREVNRQYLNHDYVTDVITFDLSDDIVNLSSLQGDVFICPQVAVDNAKEYGTTPLKETTLYVIHGILHLLGYDDKSPSKIKVMRKKEEELMKLFYKNIG